MTQLPHSYHWDGTSQPQKKKKLNVKLSMNRTAKIGLLEHR